MNINEIINDIVRRVDSSWLVLQKTRFAYIELGKCLEKNTDFFFSVDRKLQDKNLTFEEIEQIYNEENGLSTQVICRSASRLLKMVLDRLGIECKLVKSINNVMTYSEGDKSIDINHWFLAVKDSDGKWFFTTLSSDLPYIQMGMETKHFGVNISYMKELSDGTIQQVYEGEEIDNKVISKEELKQVDINIKYIKFYYTYDDQARRTRDFNLQYENASLHMLRDAVKANRMYYETELENTSFMHDAFYFEGSGGRQISIIDDGVEDLTKEDWQIWLKNICGKVLDKICEIIGYPIYPIPPLESRGWNYDAWLLSLSFMLEDEIYSRLDLKDGGRIEDTLIDVTNFNYNKWSKKVKSTFRFDHKYDYQNIILILDKMNALVNFINGKNKGGNLNALFKSLSSHFIPADSLYINNIDDDGKLSNDYIARKFFVMFAKVFSCNEIRTDFNNMSYSEQVNIIKEVLGVMFPEITLENSGMVSDYDNRYSPVLNRIQAWPIKNNETGDYAIVFGILGDPMKNDDEADNEYYFFYDLKSNKFEVCDILNVYQNYTIVSSRMKDKFSVEDLENLESQKKR